MSCSIFWGILLVLIGLSLIIKVAFNIDLPVVRIFIAFILIYLGIRLFVRKDIGTFKNTGKGYNVIFGEKTVEDVQDGYEYNILFGKGVIDLSDIQPINEKEIRIKLNTVFAGTDILFTDSVNLNVYSNSAFSGVRMPDGRTASFGSIAFKGDTNSAWLTVNVECNTVFGTTAFKEIE